MSRILGEYLHPKNMLKIFYKPHRIPYAIKNFYDKTKTFYADIKFKPQTSEYFLDVYKHSVSGLSELASNNSIKKLKIESITDILNTGIFNSPFSIKIGELFKQYGSDKSTVHDYYLVYSDVLEKKAPGRGRAEVELSVIGNISLKIGLPRPSPVQQASVVKNRLDIVETAR